jgi:biopolymer transport protein ExbD
MAKTPDKEAVIIADESAMTGTLVQTIDICTLAGVKKVSMQHR